MKRWALVCWWWLVAASGCADEFFGDGQRLRFVTPLARGYRAFDPRRDVVAVGSTVSFRCVGTADGGRVQGRFSAQAAVGGDPIFSDLDAGDGELVAVIGDAGRATLAWDAGGVVDVFALNAEAAAGLVVDDPLRAVAEPLTAGALWPAAGDAVLVAPGQSLAFEAFARTADGGPMVFSANLLSLDVTAVGRLDGGAVIIDMPSAGLPPTAVGLRLGGRTLGSFTVASAPVDRVARVELVAREVGDTLAIKATSFIDGGQVLWAAPVVWAFDPRLELVDAGLGRADVLALRGRTSSGPMIEDTVFVEARVGDAKNRLLLLASVPAQFDAGVPLRGGAPGWAQCGCSSGGGPLAVALLILGVVASRRRPRGADEPFARRGGGSRGRVESGA